MMYYVISLKWTRPSEICFTFWGPNNSGYPIDINDAGVYTQEEIEGSPDYYTKNGTFAVSKDLVDRWAVTLKRAEDGVPKRVLLNKPFIRKQLNINLLMLEGGMGDYQAFYFQDIIYPKGYEDIDPEEFYDEFTGRYNVRLKEHFPEYWHYDIAIEANSHSQAKYKAFKKWEDSFGYLLLGHDNLFIESMKCMTCRKEYAPVFKGWK